LLLRERVPALRWAATLIGLLGVLVAVGPALAAFSTGHLAIALGVALNALGLVLTRALGRSDPPETILAWVAAVGLILSVPGALAASAALPLDAWPALVLVAAAGAGAVWFSLLALRECDVSALAPYGYARLPLAALAGFAVFGQAPTLPMLAGSALILLAGLLPLLAPAPAPPGATPPPPRIRRFGP
jgi:drug/metabolite transporter (DMT)-like permease